MSNYWNFIDQFYDLQDAKRHYGVFTAAIFLGLGLGGLIISMLYTHLGVPGVLLIIVGCNIITLLISTQSSVKITVLPDDYIEEQHSAAPFLAYREIILSVVRSPFTLCMILFTMSMYLLDMITEFNYFDTLESLIPSQDSTSATSSELTLFLGKVRAWTSLVCILFSTFIFGRLIKRFGINNIFPITPILFSLIYILWGFQNGIMIAVMGFIAVEGVRDLIDTNCFNIHINVVPSKIKTIVRAAVNSFFEPIGILISALILLIPNINSRLVGLILSLLSIGIMLLLRKYYPKAVYDTLAKNALQFQPGVKECFSQMLPKEKQLNFLTLFEESKKLNPTAIELLLKTEDETFIPRLITDLTQADTPLKLKFLKQLEKSPFAQHPTILYALSQWKEKTFDFSLLESIYWYLARYDSLPHDWALSHLQSSSLKIRGAALLTLNKKEEINTLLTSGNVDEMSLALDILSFSSSSVTAQIFPFLHHFLPKVRLKAAQCLARSIGKEDQSYSKSLLRILSQSKDALFRTYILRSLGKVVVKEQIQELLEISEQFRPTEKREVEDCIHQIGESAVPILLDICKNQSLTDGCRTLAGKTLGHLNPKILRTHLVEIIQSETKRAYFYAYHYHTIQQRYPEHCLRLLEEVLETGFHSVMDFMIHLLAVSGSLEDVGLLLRSLRSQNQKIHSHAVETLEKSCDPEVFRLLEVLVDDRPSSEKVRYFLKYVDAKKTLLDVLEYLEESSSQVNHLVCFAIKKHLKVLDENTSAHPHYKELIS